MAKFTRKNLLVLLVAGFLLCVGVFAWANNVYNSPGSYSDTKHIIITKGSGVAAILTTLKNEGAISQKFILRVMAKIHGHQNFRYGEYLLEPNLSPRQIFEKLEEGAVVVRKVTIPEGKTIYEIAQILAKAEGLKGNMPEDIKEGSILPQTYHYQWGDSYEDIIAQMQKSMQTAIDRMWEFRRMDIPVSTKEEALILASIVEKETGNPDERHMVASVFTNRLKIGMPLQSDPTAVYGITGGAPLGRLPNGADMRTHNPYNTYVIPGLPPGPICNPGTDAIEAVLNPPDTDFLYFVADGLGGHNFSSNYTNHTKNVNVYRKARAVNARQKSEMIIKPKG